MRVKLTFPSPIIFSTEIKVHISDINYGGHMGNARFLTLMQEARLRWLEVYGFPDEKDIAPPIGLIVVDSAIQYKAEVFHGELLEVELAVNKVTAKSFDLYYQIKKEDKSLAALGKTGILSFDYVAKRVSAIPDVLSLVL